MRRKEQKRKVEADEKFEVREGGKKTKEDVGRWEKTPEEGQQ